MSKKLSKGERKKAVRALNKIKRELEELLGEKPKPKSHASSQSLDYSINFCPVITKKQIQVIADNVLGHKLRKEELIEVVKESYEQNWQLSLVQIIREVLQKKLHSLTL